QVARTLACPTEWRLRITARGGLDKGFEILEQSGVYLLQKRTAGTPMTGALGRQFVLGCIVGVPEFPHTRPDGSPGKTRGLGHQGHTAPLERHGFAGSPVPAHTL